MITLLRRCWWLLAPALVVFAYRFVGRNGFVADANFLIAENRYVQDLAYFWENLRHDYFWSSAGTSIPYWRPLTKASWALEYQLFGGWSGGYAFVQLGWHVLAVLAVQFLARCLALARRWAALAGLLFGLSAVAIEPVSLLMARSDVVCVCATLWAVACWRRCAESRRLRWMFPHLLAVILALGSKETGVIIAPVVTLWTLLRSLAAGSRGAKDGGRAREWLLVTPSWALGAVYLALRSQVLQAQSGSLASAPGFADPLRIFASLTRYLQNLLPFRLSSAVRNIPYAEARSLGFLLAAALTAAAAAALLAWLFRRRNVDALGLAGWVLLALAPVLLVADMSVPGITGKLPLADRWLYHALGAASLLAVLAFANVPWPRARQATLVAAAAWTVAVVAVNESVRAEYVSLVTMMRTEDRVTYFATPREFRTEEDECRFLDRQYARSVEANELTIALAQADELLARCRDDVPTRTQYRFSTLVWLGRFDEARPLAEALVKSPPRDPRGYVSLAYLAGITFLETGAPDLAERSLRASRQLGNRSCGIEQQLARVAIARSQPDQASQQLEAAYVCDGSRAPALLIDAARWSLDAGQRRRVKKLLARIRKEYPGDASLEAQIAQLEFQMARMGGSR